MVLGLEEDRAAGDLVEEPGMEQRSLVHDALQARHRLAYRFVGDHASMVTTRRTESTPLTCGR